MESSKIFWCSFGVLLVFLPPSLHRTVTPLQGAHLLLLSHPVSSVHGLQVHLRVPVAVVDDDDVGDPEFLIK